jgi:RNA polymerase sigma-70 factor (ECF subfamily)
LKAVLVRLPAFDLAPVLDYSGQGRTAAAPPFLIPEDAGRPADPPMEFPEFDYDALIRPVESRMMRSIWRIVRQKESAEDALQDALAVIWKKRRTVARHPNPEALILKIAVNAAYDAARKLRRRLRHETPGLPASPEDTGSPPLSRELEGRALRARVLESIARLPKRQATAVLLRFVEDRSFEEIAQGMGCSVTTARVHVMRGRAKLVRRLAPLKEAGDD